MGCICLNTLNSGTQFFFSLQVGVTPVVRLSKSDLPANPRNLVKVFDGCSVGSQGSNISSVGELKLWSDCADVQADLILAVPTFQLASYARFRLKS